MGSASSLAFVVALSPCSALQHVQINFDSGARSADANSAAALTASLQAVVVLRGDSPVSGTVTFEQTAPGKPVKVTGNIKGLDPNASRGFHVQCAYMYISLLCSSADCRWVP